MINSRKDHLDEVTLFSGHFKNESFVFENVDWWPLVRVQVAYLLHLQLTTKPVKQLRQNPNTNIKAASISFREKIGVLKSKFFLKQDNSSLAVITDSSIASTKDIHGNKINQFIDPFLKYFNEEHVEYDLLDLCNLNKAFASFHSIKALNLNKVIEKFNVDVSFQNKIAKIDSYFEGRHDFSDSIFKVLSKAIIENQATYLSFDWFFSKYKYERILFYCYYNNTVMAINRAAKNHKVVSIEYQHSLITNEHFAYSGWDERIANNNGFFPSMIWTWRDSDKTLLESSFKFLPQLKIIKGGNVYLSLSKDSAKKVVSSEEVKVLVTLQGLGLPNFVKEFVSENKNIFWYFRFHPRYPVDKIEIEKLISATPKNCDIEVANDESLHSLFSQVNYHLTCYSGSALEASSFNVQNIIFGEDGYRAYKQQIDTGNYFYVKSKKDLEEILKKSKISIGNTDEVLIDKNIVRKNIKQVFSV